MASAYIVGAYVQSVNRYRASSSDGWVEGVVVAVSEDEAIDIFAGKFGKIDRDRDLIFIAKLNRGRAVWVRG